MFKKFPLTRPFAPNGGHAFVVALPREVQDRLRASKNGWQDIRVFLAEDDNVLGPANDRHQFIRTTGRGAYSVWNKTEVYFSASDNSDCNSNQREYGLICVDVTRGGHLYTDLTMALSGSEDEILNLIKDNSVNYNNSFFANFFRYYNSIQAMLERNEIALPSTIVEVGPGERPFLALRFLLEGVSRYIVNDVLPVRAGIPPELTEGLQQLIRLVYPRLSDRFERILQSVQQQGRIPNIEVHELCPFEQLPIGSNEVDFVFSVAVLEHVMDPAAVIKKMATILKPGGHVWHVIDLRDHRNFNDPLGFLRLSTDEYAGIKTENRLRASDHVRLFEAQKFDLVEVEFSALDPETVDRPNDIQGANIIRHSTLDAVRPWVGDDLRRKFATPFNTYDLKDLSVLGLQVLYRKRAAS